MVYVSHCSVNVKAHAGKGVGRRSKKVVHQSNNVEDGKLKLTLRKLGCQPIDMISEVNFFPKSEDIYHFSKCQGTGVFVESCVVWISPMNNTTAVFGTPERARRRGLGRVTHSSEELLPWYHQPAGSG